MNAPWRIELFGGLQLFGDDGVVLSRFQTRKTGALLGYLAYYKEKPVSREVLADLFWPENDPEAARNSLRVALNSLRKQLEPPGIPPGGVLSADRATVRLNPHAVTTDSADFERALKAERGLGDTDEAAKTAHLLQAVDLYKGPLLSGWYEEWIDLEQTRLAEVYAGALRRLTSLLFKARDFDRALDFAQRAVQSDPLREENHRHLMRLYASMGRADDALKAFRELESILRDEMNAPPSTVTRELVKQIVALSTGAAPAQTSRNLGSVVPFLGEPVETLPPDGLPVAEPITALAPAATIPPVSHEPAGSVPLQWTRFWGRQNELSRVVTLFAPDGFAPNRMVTLSGPGGVGKTRLAVESAARLRQAGYVGSVWFVPLDDVAEGNEAQIIAAIAHVLRLPLDEVPAEEAADKIASVLSAPLPGAPSLLILDDVSQSDTGLGVAARVVTRLLEVAPSASGFRCLVTSRQRLHVAFEREMVVEPLPIPPLPPRFSGLTPGEAETGPYGSAVASAPAHLLGTLSSCASVALFVERAQTVRPDFQITPRNAFAIADLCRRLDGLPLALELAAAWSRLLSPAQMVERTTENCFALLTSERRDLVPRHRSLFSVLSNACRDLTPPMRSFLAALSVFDGGFSLDAAQTVCAAEAGDATAADVLMLLDALQSRSLLASRETSHGLRFHLLQTTRCFAETLFSPGQKARISAAYAGYYVHLVRRAEPFLSGTEAEAWRLRLDDEQENLRGLLRTACASEASADQIAHCLIIAASLWRYWYVRGQSDEGCAYLETLLHHSAANQTAPHVRACALHGAGRLALNLGYATRAGAWFEQCFALLPDKADRASAVPFALTKTLVARDRAIAARAHGDLDAARNALQIVLTEKQAENDAWGVASVLTEWGSDALLRGDADAAQTAFAQSAALRRLLGDRWGAAEADAGRAQALAADEQGNAADALKQRAANEMETLGDVHGIAASFLNLGYVAAEQNDWETALPLLRDAVSLFGAQNDHPAVALGWWIIARAAFATGAQNEKPLAVSAAEAALNESQSGTGTDPKTGAEYETRIAVLSRQLLEQMRENTFLPGARISAS